ncbi:MAG: glycerol-3-phosphate acyltransferase [Myxococcota bacterium]
MGALQHSVIAWTTLAYFVAAIPVGVLIARAKHIDLREVGSGNIGATNAARALGGRMGIVVLILDVGKAALPVFLASRASALGGTEAPETAIAWVAMAAVLGHIFPVYLAFRGGKGVACALGVFLAIDWPIGVVALLMYAQGAVLTRTSAVGSLTAVTAAALTTIVAGKPVTYQVLCVAISVIIWVRHRSNIRGMIAEAKERKRATAPENARRSGG